MTEKDEMLEQYKVMVETVTSDEHRRQLINTIYITLFAVVLGAGIEFIDLTRSYVTLPGFIVSFIWGQQLINNKNLVKAKFDVIHKLEQELSFSPFKDVEVTRKKGGIRGWINLLEVKLAKNQATIEIGLPLMVFIYCYIQLILNAICHFTNETYCLQIFCSSVYPCAITLFVSGCSLYQ